MDKLSQEILKLMESINNLNNNDEFTSVKNIKHNLNKLSKYLNIDFDNINIKDNDY